MAESGFVLWLTGLSGAGKTTLAGRLAGELRRRGRHVEVFDGDEMRSGLCAGLGFSRADRDENVRRIAFVAAVAARCGACAIVAAISPYRQARAEARQATPRFCEVYCECPLDVLERRDDKGLYRRARAGELRHLTGLDDPYEPPELAELLLRTDREPAEASAARIVAWLEQSGWIR